MTKTCSEIVNAALDLSQLETSNMLSYARMIYLLNSAYDRLYDFVTDMTEDWGSRQLIVGENITVPEDFMKLRGVYKWDELRERAGDELERVDHEPNPGQYWLHGEELHCKGSSPTDSFLVRYYPVPFTLTFPCKAEPCPYSKIYDNYAGYIEGQFFKVTNLINGQETEYPFLGEVREWLLVHGTPVWIDDTNTLHDVQDEVENVSGLFLDKWGDYAYSYEDDNGDRWDVTWDGDIIAHPHEFSHNIWGAHYMYEVPGKIYRADPETPDEWEDVTDNFIDDRHVITGALFSTPYIVILKQRLDGSEATGEVFAEDGSRYVIRPMLRQGNTPPVTLIDFDHDDENGYGIIYKVRGVNEIAGFLPDTALDYPKTIYFDWLEAELAKLFLIEARQDVSTVDALAGQYWTRLMEMSQRQINYAYKLKDRRGIRR